MGGQDKWPAPPTGSRKAVLGDVAHLIDKIHQDLSGRQFIHKFCQFPTWLLQHEIDYEGMQA